MFKLKILIESINSTCMYANPLIAKADLLKHFTKRAVRIRNLFHFQPLAAIHSILYIQAGTLIFINSYIICLFGTTVIANIHLETIKLKCVLNNLTAGQIQYKQMGIDAQVHIHTTHLY